MSRTVSLLDHALLGLLRQEPASGYDLRKIFASTPMASFSDSPGAIYPALRRLEEGGLIRGRVEESAGLRRRKLFRLSAEGKAELERWLAQPLARDDVVSGMEELILRFAFMEGAMGKSAVVRFLKGFEREVSAHLPTLRVFLKAHRAGMPTSAWLAVEFGIRSYEAQLEWCRHAIGAYREKKGRDSQ
jgi:DNA-binding PadR family transcriptional regulator